MRSFKGKETGAIDSTCFFAFTYLNTNPQTVKLHNNPTIIINPLQIS